MAGSSWPTLVAGAKAKASEVEAKFDWSEEDIVPHAAGTKTNATYDIGETSFRFRDGFFSGTILVGNGSAASPSYSFDSDQDGGLYRISANVVGVSAGGTGRIRIDGSVGSITLGGVVAAAAGFVDIGTGSRLRFIDANSAASPSISWSSDADTGIYFDSVNTRLTFCHSAADVFELRAGHLTMLAAAEIEILAGSAGTPSLNFSTDGDTGMFLSASNIIGFAGGGVEQLQVRNGFVSVVGGIRATVDNSVPCGVAGTRWSDVRSVLINGADYGFANGWFIREYPATFKDIQTQDSKWFRKNANQGLQIVNDRGQLVMVIGEDGTLYTKELKTLNDLDEIIRSKNISSKEDKEYEKIRRKEIRGKKEDNNENN